MLDKKEKPLGQLKEKESREHEEIDNLFDFSPYHDDPEGRATANNKALPPLPQDANLPTRRSIIHRIVISVVTVFSCFLVIFVVLSRTGFISELRKEHLKTNPQCRSAVSPSGNFALSFPEQYPPLNSARSTAECRSAWQTLTEIPCHDAIWTRNWDDGVFHPSGPSLDRFVPLICDERCAPVLEEAHKTIRSACSGEDVFDVEGYKGRFNTRLLESGPAEVLDVLVERRTRSCRRSPTGDAERGFCMTDLDSRWNIIDGMRSNGLDALQWFVSHTDRVRTEKAGRHSGMQGSGGWSENYNYLREGRKFGPGRGETTCSWCTLNWFTEKLRLWEEGMMDSNGVVLGLPEFLRTWEKAGRRCAGDGFEDAYQAAILEYIDRGLLDADWDSRPSGDIPYLIQHGPTAVDSPARDVDQAIATMIAYRNRTAKINPEVHARIKHQAVVNEYIGCLNFFKTAILDLQCYPFLSHDQLLEYVLSDLQTAKQSCSEKCLTSIQSFQTKIYAGCPSLWNRGSYHGYQTRLKFVHNDATTSFVEKFFQRGSPILTYEAVCRSASDWGYSGLPCAAVYTQLGKQDWVFKNPTTEDLINTTRMLLAELPEMPEQLKEWKNPGRRLTPEEQQIDKDFSNWREKMSEGVCSDCMWRRFAERHSWWQGMIPKGTPEDVVIEWIKTGHLLREECADRGRKFPEFELKSVDERWKKMYSEEAWNGAFAESRQQPDSLSEHEELV